MRRWICWKQKRGTWTLYHLSIGDTETECGKKVTGKSLALHKIELAIANNICNVCYSIYLRENEEKRSEYTYGC